MPGRAPPRPVVVEGGRAGGRRLAGALFFFFFPSPPRGGPAAGRMGGGGHREAGAAAAAVLAVASRARGGAAGKRGPGEEEAAARCVRGCCSGDAPAGGEGSARGPGLPTPLRVLPAEQVDVSGVLASGPHSEVLQGLWGRKPVALKVPRLPTSASLDAFHHELGVLLKLRQRPNVVQLLGAAAHPPDYSYLLALEEGSLSGLVSAKPLRGLSLVGCALQAARGLREVHLLGLLHRDVKPDNLLYSLDVGGSEGGLAVRLADFGLAGPPEGVEEDGEKPGAQEGAGGHSTSLGLARRRTRGRRGGKGAEFFRGSGTLEYMAPEVLLKQRASFPADVYSLGVTLNELAAGVRPFEGATKERPGCHTVLEVGYGRAELAAAVATHGLRPDLPTGVPAAFLDLVQRCWAAEAGARPRLDEVVRTLERLYSALRDNGDVEEEGSEMESTPSNSGSVSSSSLPPAGPGTPPRLKKAKMQEGTTLPTDPSDAEGAGNPAGPPLFFLSREGLGSLLCASARTSPGSPAPLMEAGTFQTQGRREHQEDRCLLAGAAPDGRRLNSGGGSLAGAAGVLVGVFDGHRGHEAADFAAKEMEAALAAALTGGAHSYEPGEALRAAFLDVDRRFRELPSFGSGATATFPGTTALAALILGDRLIVANAGDCRALLGSRGERTYILTTDHCTANASERRRVEAAGGTVVHRVDTWRVGRAALQCTRSLGDADAKAEGVIAEPEVVERRLVADDEFLVVASDGLWDVLEAADVCSLIRDTVKHPGMAAQRLATEALTRGSADNVSVAVVFFGGGGSWERVYHEGSGAPRGGGRLPPAAFQAGRENFRLPARDEMMECD